MSIPDFLQPRLVGARFDGPAIPLEVLKDLAVFEEMLMEVAKWRFLQENKDRKRSPRGFSDGVEFKLTELRNGSARPVISLVIAANSLFPSERQVYFEQARNAAISAIQIAERGGQPADELPIQALSYFDRIGRSFRDGEAMEFVSPVDGSLARLTKESRRRLVLASASVKELTEDVAVRGSIPEADQDKMTFQVQLIDGRKVIDIPLAAPHLPTILEAFGGYKSGTRVLIEGIGRFNRQQRLLGFEFIQHVSALEPLDVRARLEEFQLLKDGWLEGRGIAPKPQGLSWFADTFERRFPEDLVLPFLYPTEDGGLQAEWSLNGFDISLDVSLFDHRGQFHRFNPATRDEDVRELNLDSDNDWRWLAEEIKQTAGV